MLEAEENTGKRMVELDKRIGGEVLGILRDF